VGECCGERAFVAAGEADQSGGEFFQVVEGCSAFGLGGFAHLEAGDELAEILIADLRGAEQQQARRLGRELVGSQEGGVRRLPKELTAISAPMWALMPHLVAMVWKRARRRGRCGRQGRWRAFRVAAHARPALQAARLRRGS
jgi:hypothetical protein